MVLVISMVKKLLENPMTNSCKRQRSQKEFRIEEVIRRKGGGLYVKRKGYDNLFNNWIKMKDITRISQYFPEAYEHYGGNLRVELDLSNYATKDDLKGDIDAGISTFTSVSKSDFTSLKTKVDNLE